MGLIYDLKVAKPVGCPRSDGEEAAGSQGGAGAADSHVKDVSLQKPAGRLDAVTEEPVQKDKRSWGPGGQKGERGWKRRNTDGSDSEAGE